MEIPISLSSIGKPHLIAVPENPIGSRPCILRDDRDLWSTRVLQRDCGETDTMGSHRRKLIVIHGLGGTFAEAVRRIRDLLAFDCYWHDGAFCVDRRLGHLLRHILNQPETGRYVQAVKKLVVSRFLACCGQPAPPSANDGTTDVARFRDTRILEEFATFGIPLTPAARQRRAEQLRQEAQSALAPVMPLINHLSEELVSENGTVLSEAGARRVIAEQARGSETGAQLMSLLEAARDMHETGGDLDTVASAALYTHWLRSKAEQAGESFVYGRDFRYVFVNYHDSLRFLADHGPADVLMADLPVGALPSFEDDVRHLGERGVKFERFEDHHPYTAEHKAMFERLRENALVGFYELSGPLPDEALDASQARCGADMVYDNLVRGKPWDTQGARTLQRVTHAEDLACRREDLGRLLTNLIKGGVCKVELAQLLADGLAGDDIAERLAKLGWDRLAEDWATYFEEVESELLENAGMLTFNRPARSLAAGGGARLGVGSDMPRPRREASDNKTRILVALAVSSKPGQPKITTGKAVEFYGRVFPEADYVFYCYGARLMVTRRLNQADLAFNLGTIMPHLGGAGDGGHAGAAVCRPDTNPAYPRQLIGRLTAANFRAFCRYLGTRLHGLGYDLPAVQDRSKRSDGAPMRRGGKRLTVVTLLAIAVGLLLVLFHPKFRRSRILDSNQDFFRQLSEEAGE